MNDKRPSAAQRTERTRTTGWFVDGNQSKKDPIYKRTDVLVMSAAVAILVLAGLSAFVMAETSKPSRPAAVRDSSNGTTVTTIEEPTLPATTNPVLPGHIKPVATTTPPTTTHSPVTSRSSTAAAKTTSSTPSTEPLAASGRFSGVIAAKNGDTWVITGWDGVPVQVTVTPSTQLNAPLIAGPQFGPGQTVSIFWVNSGGARVAQSIYGVS